MEYATQPASPEQAESLQITIHEMGDFVDAESMRVVRNQVRGFMTHNTGYINRPAQVDWFNNVYTPSRRNNEMVGFVLQSADSDPVGYGLIQKKYGRYWVGGGLTEALRGQGVGQQLFSYLTRYTHSLLEQQEVWLDVREDNPAQHLYAKLGYTAVGRSSGLIIMKHVQSGDSDV